MSETSEQSFRYRKNNFFCILLQLDAGLNVLGVEEVYYRDSVGRILVEDVVAKDPLPPFPASTKDGYAVIAADGPGVKKVMGEASAGCSPGMSSLTPGHIVR